MNRMLMQAGWIAPAREVLPAAGFGKFDASMAIARDEGSRVWDDNGKENVDYLIGSGPVLLGYGAPEVIEAVFEQIPNGMTFFANNAKGIELAEAIVDAVPCRERVRFVASGGEVDMDAIRLARAYTGKPKTLKFESRYHGMLAKAQIDRAPAKDLTVPTCVPETSTFPRAWPTRCSSRLLKTLGAAVSLLGEHTDVAAIIFGPLQRIIPAPPGPLQGLCDLCSKHSALFIFDEIVTSFRFAYGGAQERYGMTADICTLGEVIGDGFPPTALGVRAEVVSHLHKARVGADRWLMQLAHFRVTRWRGCRPQDDGDPAAARDKMKSKGTWANPDGHAARRLVRHLFYQNQSSGLSQCQTQQPQAEPDLEQHIADQGCLHVPGKTLSISRPTT